MLLIFGSKQGANRNSDAYAVNNYTLYDKFTTALAAGSVNATNAEPVGGARTVVDTNSKISITGGVLDFATGGANFDGVWYPIQTRVLGKTLLGTIIRPASTGTMRMGWDSNTSGQLILGTLLTTTNLQLVLDASTAPVVGLSGIATYYIAVTMRSAGAFFYIKGGLFTNWTLIYVSTAGNANLYPMIAYNASTLLTADNIRVPKRLYIPVPLESDGMSATTTDGAGNAEANGVVGTAYTNVGTWGVASGARSCSVLSGGLGFSYLACTSSNVIIDAAVTRGAGVAGLVARYADSSNYLIAYHDGTNAKLDKVVAGVTTSLISAAATYSAGAVLRLILDGTSARLFYNNAAVGVLTTVPSSTSLNHGLYTTDILSNGNSFDNLIVWARGSEGQYNGLDAL